MSSDQRNTLKVAETKIDLLKIQGLFVPKKKKKNDSREYLKFMIFSNVILLIAKKVRSCVINECSLREELNASFFVQLYACIQTIAWVKPTRHG